MSSLKAGTRLKSATCETEVMVVRAAPVEVILACGGVEMQPLGAARSPDAAPAAGLAGGTIVGKRYVDDADRFELLCTKAGKGTLTIDGVPLTVKQAKALPSSD